jgi:NAD(P)-dependent dehydrogenase (short-subunit alcohol dehydrogenase family)
MDEETLLIAPRKWRGAIAEVLPVDVLDASAPVDVFEARLARGVPRRLVMVIPSTAEATPLGAVSDDAFAAGCERPLRRIAMVLSRLLEEWLVARIAGAIVLVLERGVPGALPAEMLHAAIGGLVRSLAKEYGRRGVRVNAVVARTAQEAALPVAWLAVEASFVTGETLQPRGDREP